ncbi:serine/threonine-protein kinase [Mycolicibacterium goodii]|uniref:non-specific serine/threonine protein kinase n=1 Tax=Mycolicibacterium goodii TaxID=134601 RepID=A0ABS6HZX9_MYCGD|nr:serine/threonine-protein kinase [Mycolicibacterium goodii]MBU8827244.1 serine/threonine protein kinase [Mycolicibacterium goodii]MBU8835411.1 serine/threonine protein kinase [Mycolicibacterium goodii]
MRVVSPGERIAGFAVEDVAGRGGWAVVYRARDANGRPVALKVLNDSHREPAHLERLRREFDFACRAAHPNVVAMYSAGRGWLAMEFIDGRPVTCLAARTDQLAALAQIADALDHTHRLGIVHSDVKPANLLVDKPFSRAVLIDFGVAHSLAEDVAARLAADATGRLTLDPARRITHHTKAPRPQVQASLPYSAPELVSGRALSAATDQYGLACTAVEVLTGLPPFTATTPVKMVDQQLNSPPPRISDRADWIPHAVDSIFAKALAKDPERRYESCAQFVRDLAEAFDE